MATANAARSLADDNDDVTKMSEGTSAGDISELTESERDFRLKMKTEYQPECDDEERRRLDELLTQCHDYIYSCQSQSHLMTSSKIITNGSLTSRTTSSPPNDVTPGVMAACWLELPVSSSYDAFPFPANDVVECSAVTSHVRCHDYRARSAEEEVAKRRDDVTESRVNQLKVLYGRISDVASLRVDAVEELKAELSAVESSWSDDVGELEKCWTQLDDVKRRQVELMIDADNERKQREKQLTSERRRLRSLKRQLQATTTTKSTDAQQRQLQHDVETQQRYLEDLEFQLLELETRREVEREPEQTLLMARHMQLQQQLADKQESLRHQQQHKLELVSQAKADVTHLDAEYHLLLDSIRQEERLVERNSTTEAALNDFRPPRHHCRLGENDPQEGQGQRSKNGTAADDDNSDNDDDVWRTLLQLEQDITDQQPWNRISDVTGDVDDKDVTTLTTAASDIAAAYADDVDDDVDELSSSDLSSSSDAKRNNNLTSSTDDNLASCSCSTDTISDSRVTNGDYHHGNDNDHDVDYSISLQQHPRTTEDSTTTAATAAADDTLCSQHPSAGEEMQCVTSGKSRRLPDTPATTTADNQHVVLRAKRSSQCRPLTRYLPVRESSFNLRQFVESSGHSVEDHASSVQLTSTTCQGALCKMTRRGPLHAWHRRWFVFDRAHRTLSWHSSRPHSAFCRRGRHSVPFDDIVDVFLDHLRSVRSPTPHLTFCVKTRADCIYLTAPSAGALRIWVDVIVTGAEGYQQW